MRRAKVICVLLWITFNGFSQNLIPNGSFEEYSELPVGISQLNRAEGWFSLHQFSTPDYFNNQSFTDGILAQEGFGYAGIFVWSSDELNPYREYLSVKLKENLEKGVLYHLSFYHRSANDKQDFEQNNLTVASTNGIQFLLSKDTIKQYNAKAVTISTQVLFEEPVSTGIEWQKVSVIFEASEEFQFLTIGNFLQNNKVAYEIFRQSTNPDISWRIYSYYYFDNFTLEKVRQPIQGDTLYQVCKGNEVELKITGDLNNKWYNSKKQLVAQNIESFVITPDTNTSYTIIGTTDTFTIKIEVSPKPQATYQNQTLCYKDVLPLLNQNLPFYDSLKVSPVLESNTIKEEGTYFIDYKLGYCTEKDTLEIKKIDCEVILKYPNVFTPNGDDKNDFFVPLEYKNIAKGVFRVYNRWGKEVFKTEELSKGWDGQAVEDGVYFYSCDFVDINGMESAVKGWVQVLK